MMIMTVAAGTMCRYDESTIRISSRITTTLSSERREEDIPSTEICLSPSDCWNNPNFISSGINPGRVGAGPGRDQHRIIIHPSRTTIRYWRLVMAAKATTAAAALWIMNPNDYPP